MKNRYKKILAVITFLVCSIIIIASRHNNVKATYTADENGITWQYEVYDNQITTLYYYEGTIPENLEIPSYLGGYPVVGITENYAAIFPNESDALQVITIKLPETMINIPDYAFYNCSNLTSITIPERIKNIGIRAFANCSSLTNIEIPNSVTSIESEAFANCSSLTNIEIPNSVTSIESGAFANCSSLTNIEIPNSLEKIEYNTFSGCSSLTSIEIPANVNEIGEKAFYNCSNLTAITIPEGVTRIGREAFANCRSLSNIEIADSVINIEKNAFDETGWYNNLESGVVYAGKVLYNYKGSMPENTEINVRENTKSISARCFEEKSNLIKITLPDSVININEGAFSGCNNLVSINLPNNLECIKNYTFSGCSKLNAINIPTNIKEIESSAFYGCSSLVNILIPGSIEKINSYAFSGCTNLEKVTIGDEQETYNEIVEIGYSVFNNCNKLQSFITYKTVNFNIDRYGANIFAYDNNLEEVKLLSGVLNIGDNTFYNCSKLSNIEIRNMPDELKEDGSIGSMAFANCISLTSITLPDNINYIGSGAFSGCSNLEEIRILGTINYIGKGAFRDTKIYIGSEESHFRDTNITSLIIQEGIGEIDEKTFMGAENLKSINLPSTIYYIDNRAFYGCNNLKDITIPDENPYFTVEDGVIYNKDKTTLIRCMPGKDTKIEIPNSVVNIESYAFFGCSKLKGTLTVPGSVKLIPENAFSACKSEIPLILQEGITKINNKAFIDSCFTGDLIIPDSVTNIGAHAFKNCNKFNGILKLGENLKYLGYFSFYNCYNFTGDLVIPEKLSSIPDYAFAGCSGFNGKLIMDNGVKTINRCAFMNCTGIKQIIAKQEVSNAAFSGAFFNCTSLENNGGIYGYKAAFSGCSNLTEINFTGYGQYYKNVSEFEFNGLENLEELRIGENINTIGVCSFARCNNLKTIYIPASVNTIYENAFYKCNNIQDIYVDKYQEDVTFDEELRKYCDNIHYLEHTYTIDTETPENIEIVKLEDSTDGPYEAGSNFKFKVVAKEGYTLDPDSVIVKTVIEEEELELNPQEIEGELVYTIENIQNNIKIVVNAEVIEE